MEQPPRTHLTKGVSFYKKAWTRFLENKTSISGLIILLSLVLIALLAPLISPHDPTQQYWGQELVPPSARFPLGTDSFGTDVLSKIIWGARTSLVVGIVSVSIMLAIGVTLGSLSGYHGGKIDSIVMRITDIFLCVPTILLLIVIASTLATRNLLITMVIIGLVNWPQMARVTRSQFLSLREETFVEAARVAGASNTRIILRHILPSALSPIIIVATIQIANAIIAESTLSFLGLGDPSAISWGNLLSRGRDTLREAWWVATFPGLAIFITVLGLNLVGDGLRDAFDVRL
jgi:peptide/nickel transport system permease protein